MSDMKHWLDMFRDDDTVNNGTDEGGMVMDVDHFVSEFSDKVELVHDIGDNIYMEDIGAVSDEEPSFDSPGELNVEWEVVAWGEGDGSDSIKVHLTDEGIPSADLAELDDYIHSNADDFKPEPDYSAYDDTYFESQETVFEDHDLSNSTPVLMVDNNILSQLLSMMNSDDEPVDPGMELQSPEDMTVLPPETTIDLPLDAPDMELPVIDGGEEECTDLVPVDMDGDMNDDMESWELKFNNLVQEEDLYWSDYFGKDQNPEIKEPDISYDKEDTQVHRVGGGEDMSCENINSFDQIIKEFEEDDAIIDVGDDEDVLPMDSTMDTAAHDEREFMDLENDADALAHDLGQVDHVQADIAMVMDPDAPMNDGSDDVSDLLAKIEYIQDLGMSSSDKMYDLDKLATMPSNVVKRIYDRVVG